MERRSSVMAAASSSSSSFFVATVLFLQQLALVTAQKGSTWLTLSGNAPAVVARGGLSGMFPDSSFFAYAYLGLFTPDAVSWCDVQFTKDGVGICLPDLKLNNCTNIAYLYQNRQNNYLVNGVNITGWFSVDFNWADLVNVTLLQPIFSRNPYFDLIFGIIKVEIVGNLTRPGPPPAMWLNIQHDAFYKQQGLNMTKYVLSVSKSVILKFLSSPEMNFLSAVAKSFSNTSTKLIFRFLDQETMEPTTKQTYGSLLKNFTFIKTFASGILVPKTYIWPVTPDNYLLPHTSIVSDAHKAGLEIYAADLANDNQFSYNYSYDPLAEVLSYVDNGNFSVDGVVSDFPITPSEAIGCFAHLNHSSIDNGKPYIFSYNGDSGDYPDCTDLAYKGAVAGGADFIDCLVQVTQDKVAICMSSIDLVPGTTVTQSVFKNSFYSIPEIQTSPGIFTFNLTWGEIQTLQPQISSPDLGYKLERNPQYKNAGKFMTLSDFLSFAKGKPLAGVLIRIEHAAFMAQQLGYGVVDAVISSLTQAGFSNQTALQVLIQSPDSAVLVKFKEETKYKLVYEIAKNISDADNASVSDIKKFASAVALYKKSIYPTSELFTLNQTNIVATLHNAGLEVYGYVFRNEFMDQPWDFYSDATVQINSYVEVAGIDGIITDFPATARTYKRNSCQNLGNSTPPYMEPFMPGSLVQLIPEQMRPPVLPPLPVLKDSDVVEPPLPSPVNSTTPPPAPKPASAVRHVALSSISLTMTVICGMLILIM